MNTDSIGICKELELFRRISLWGKAEKNNEISRKCHYFKWDLVCSSKDKGGLNFRKTSLKNLAFLLKWWWKFITERDRLVEIP